MKANAPGGYALALFFFVGGLLLTIEGGKMLLDRWLAKQA
jgi:hypothetical protein